MIDTFEILGLAYDQLCEIYEKNKGNEKNEMSKEIAEETSKKMNEVLEKIMSYSEEEKTR